MKSARTAEVGDLSWEGKETAIALMPDITDGWIKLYRRIFRDTKFQLLSGTEQRVLILYWLIARWQPPFRGWLYDLADDNPRPLSLRDRARLVNVAPSTLADIDEKLASPEFCMINIHPPEGPRKPSRIYIPHYRKYQPGGYDTERANASNAKPDAKPDANPNTPCSVAEREVSAQRTPAGCEEDEAMPDNTTTDAVDEAGDTHDESGDFDADGVPLPPKSETVSIKKPKKKDKGRKSLSCTDVQAKDCAEDTSSAPFSERHKELWAEWWSVFPGRTLREVIERYEAVGSMLSVKPVELEEANELEAAILAHKDGAAYRALDMCLSSNPQGLAEVGITCIIRAMRITGPRKKKPRKQRDGPESTKPKRRERPTV